MINYEANVSLQIVKIMLKKDFLRILEVHGLLGDSL